MTLRDIDVGTMSWAIDSIKDVLFAPNCLEAVIREFNRLEYRMDSKHSKLAWVSDLSRIRGMVIAVINKATIVTESGISDGLRMPWRPTAHSEALEGHAYYIPTQSDLYLSDNVVRTFIYAFFTVTVLPMAILLYRNYQLKKLAVSSASYFSWMVPLEQMGDGHNTYHPHKVFALASVKHKAYQTITLNHKVAWVQSCVLTMALIGVLSAISTLCYLPAQLAISTVKNAGSYFWPHCVSAIAIIMILSAIACYLFTIIAAAVHAFRTVNKDYRLRKMHTEHIILQRQLGKPLLTSVSGNTFGSTQQPSDGSPITSFCMHGPYLCNYWGEEGVADRHSILIRLVSDATNQALQFEKWGQIKPKSMSLRQHGIHIFVNHFMESFISNLGKFFPPLMLARAIIAASCHLMGLVVQHYPFQLSGSTPTAANSEAPQSNEGSDIPITPSPHAANASSIILETRQQIEATQTMASPALKQPIPVLASANNPNTVPMALNITGWAAAGHPDYRPPHAGYDARNPVHLQQNEHTKTPWSTVPSAPPMSECQQISRR